MEVAIASRERKRPNGDNTRQNIISHFEVLKYKRHEMQYKPEQWRGWPSNLGTGPFISYSTKGAPWISGICSCDFPLTSWGQPRVKVGDLGTRKRSSYVCIIRMIITITMTITTTNGQILCSLKLHRCQAHQMTRRGEAAKQLRGHGDIIVVIIIIKTHQKRHVCLIIFPYFSSLLYAIEAKGKEITNIGYIIKCD